MVSILHRVNLIFHFLATIATAMSMTENPLDTSITTRAIVEPILIEQFPIGAWAENILPLSNDSIYTTFLNAPELTLVNVNDPKSPPITVATNPFYTSFLGIARPQLDEVAVVAGRFTSVIPSTASAVPGSFAILVYKVDLLNSAKPPVLSMTIPIPGSGFVDGLTALPFDPYIVLAGDSKLGLLWRVNLLTSVVDIAVADPLLQQPAGSFTPGVNGLKAHPYDFHVYFTNSASAIFGKVLITPNGMKLAPAQVVVPQNGTNAYDDFAISPDGRTAYLCNTPPNAISKVNLRAKLPTTAAIVAGGDVDTPLDHPVGAIFGVSPDAKDTLFISTAGSIPGLGGTTGGQIFKLDTRVLC